MKSLNSKLMIDALRHYQNHIRIEEPFKAQRIDEQIELLEHPTHSTILLNTEGGDWLGAARNWMQCKASNGSDVIWGSSEVLNMGPLRVSAVEELSARVAAAAINEFKGLR